MSLGIGRVRSPRGPVQDGASQSQKLKGAMPKSTLGMPAERKPEATMKLGG